MLGKAALSRTGCGLSVSVLVPAKNLDSTRESFITKKHHLTGGGFMLEDFKKFAIQGNVMDMAVGGII